MKTIKDFNEQELKLIIQQSDSIADAIEKMGFNKKASVTRKKLNNLITLYKIPTDHLYKEKSKNSWDIQKLTYAIKNNVCYHDVLVTLNIQPRSGNFTTLKRKIKLHQLDVSHFNPLQSKNNLNRLNHPVLLSDILLGKYPNYSTTNLKNRLIKEGVKDHRCESCKLNNWMKGLIPLELNHKDGNSKNHVRSNLELLCPNCHALTPTYKSKNIRYQKLLT